MKKQWSTPKLNNLSLAKTENRHGGIGVDAKYDGTIIDLINNGYLTNEEGQAILDVTGS